MVHATHTLWFIHIKYESRSPPRWARMVLRVGRSRPSCCTVSSVTSHPAHFQHKGFQPQSAHLRGGRRPGAPPRVQRGGGGAGAACGRSRGAGQCSPRPGQRGADLPADSVCPRCATAAVAFYLRSFLLNCQPKQEKTIR